MCKGYLTTFLNVLIRNAQNVVFQVCRYMFSILCCLLRCHTLLKYGTYIIIIIAIDNEYIYIISTSNLIHTVFIF